MNDSKQKLRELLVKVFDLGEMYGLTDLSKYEKEAKNVIEEICSLIENKPTPPQ